MKETVCTLPENTRGRDFVVGDLHGCFDELEDALKAVAFNPERDRLFCAGDLINRGPGSARVLHYLSQSWFFAVKGNHEAEYAPRLRKNTGSPLIHAWTQNETRKTLKAIEQKLNALPLVIEIRGKNGGTGIVHASVPEGLSWADFKEKLQENKKKIQHHALYARNKILRHRRVAVEGIGRVFSGHTLVPFPIKLENHFFIETGVYTRYLPKKDWPTGYLTLADIHANTADICNPRPVTPYVKVATRAADSRIAPAAL